MVWEPNRRQAIKTQDSDLPWDYTRPIFSHIKSGNIWWHSKLDSRSFAAILYAIRRKREIVVKIVSSLPSPNFVEGWRIFWLCRKNVLSSAVLAVILAT